MLRFRFGAEEQREDGEGLDVKVLAIVNQKGVVELVDRYTIWLLGHQSNWWNSKMIDRELAETHPDISQEIHSLLEVYDKARYSKFSDPVGSESAHEIEAVLNALKSKRNSCDGKTARERTERPSTF